MTDKIPAWQEDAGGFSVRANCQRESTFDICEEGKQPDDNQPESGRGVQGHNLEGLLCVSRHAKLMVGLFVEKGFSQKQKDLVYMWATY